MTPLPRAGIPAAERLIVALDMPTVEEARRTVERLGDTVRFYKIGLSLVFDEGYWPLVTWIVGQGKKAFADLKLYDIPETVEAAVRKLVGRGVSFTTVHAHENMIGAAIAARGGHADLGILAVTVLTSLDRGDFEAQGLPAETIGREDFVLDLVLSRARRMLAAGCDGIVSSGLEAPRLRQEHGDRAILVVPGIRPVANADDQKRTVDVEQAFRNGADYIVVGRPVLKAANQAEAAEAIQRRIARVFGGCG